MELSHRERRKRQGGVKSRMLLALVAIPEGCIAIRSAKTKCSEANSPSRFSKGCRASSVASRSASSHDGTREKRRSCRPSRRRIGRQVSKGGLLGDGMPSQVALLILSVPTHTSLRSLTVASGTPMSRTARSTICEVTLRSNQVRGTWIE